MRSDAAQRNSDGCRHSGGDELVFRQLQLPIEPILAELGCSEMQIRSITGHRTAKQVSVYTRDANLAVLATEAIAKLDRHMAGSHQVPPQEAIAEGGTEPAANLLNTKG